MQKLALLSHILPPSPSGQPTVLHRVLRSLPPESYCLISSADYSQSNENEQLRLPARYYHLPAEFQFKRPYRFRLYRIRDALNILLQVFQRARCVAKIAKGEKCGLIVACSGDVADIPAAYLASRWSRLPFYAYIFDDYLHQWTRRLHRSFVRRAERIAIKGAAGVIVPNEFLRDEYRRRYGIEPTVIHNPYEETRDEMVGDPAVAAGESGARIVFTGAIYHANFDAFRSLVAGIRELNRPNLTLHVYTFQHPDALKNESIFGPIMVHDYVTPPEAQRIQRQADILFLPLSLDSVIPDVLKTSAPGKMGEYLASGRPILIHAPPDSFVNWYFREYECGIVVDRGGPEYLAEAIGLLLDDANLRQKIVENAQERARVDFSLAAAQDKFIELFARERRGT
jgi:glycosyltransferase involved in cell wall biosynthesis